MPNLVEGRDFMLLDRNVHKEFENRYGLMEESEPLSRYGIKLADGETIVELYLKKMNIAVVPNTNVFNFT